MPIRLLTLDIWFGVPVLMFPAPSASFRSFRMPHGKTFSSILETTYNTPLVQLKRVIPAGGATVAVK